MTRITPRTCLWPLAGSLSIAFALSIALTFRSNHYCYAATCGEWLFPLQARLHIVVWYCWLSIFVTFLAVRAFSPELRRLLLQPLTSRKLPIIHKHITLSALLAFAWIVLLYGALIGVWWVRLHDYFLERGLTGGISKGNQTLAAVALLGHLCDVTMGMVLIPISRHSALASFFSLSVSTTMTFHMLTAYTLFALVLIHGFLYIGWVAVFNSLSAQLRLVFPVLNPTYLYSETWPGRSDSLGIWRASLIFSGLVAAAIMTLVFVTTLPRIRRNHFNLFYYTHLLVIVAVIVICLHASTVFYCAAPGLFMWVLDWGMRLYELRQKLDSKVASIGNGWYCLSVRLPRRRLDGCACTSPLAHFYLYHSETSVRQLHPFTTTSHLASKNSITPATEDDFPIHFLFRKQGHTKASSETAVQAHPQAQAQQHGLAFWKQLVQRRNTPTTEWTDKLASLADRDASISTFTSPSPSPFPPLSSPPPSPPSPIASTPHIDEASEPPSFHPYSPQTSCFISLRVEGPYFTPADPARHRTVICLVAGTGVSGALAIVGAFRELGRECAGCGVVGEGEEGEGREERGRTWERCVVVWSVRADQFVELPFLSETNPVPNLEIRIHLTGDGRPRLDMAKMLSDIRDTTPSLESSPSGDKEARAGARVGTGVAEGNDTWVYLSGPNAFIEAGEQACKGVPGVECHSAKWEI